MKQIKLFLDGAVKALGKVLVIVFLFFMLVIMSSWTVGLAYVANQGGCHLEQERVVCELSKE